MRNISRIFILATALLLNLDHSATAAVSAPQFQLNDSSGSSVSLSDYKGRQPVLLFFWTTWCPYCRKELQDLNNSYAVKMQSDGIQVLAVNVGESAGKVSGYIGNNKVTLRVLLDQNSDVAYDYHLVGVPTFVLIDNSGEIVFMNNYFPYDSYRKLLK